MIVHMATVYVDEELKNLIQARVDAMSQPDDGIIVSEKDAMVEMLAEQYETEYRRRKGEAEFFA